MSCGTPRPTRKGSPVSLRPDKVEVQTYGTSLIERQVFIPGDLHPVVLGGEEFLVIVIEAVDIVRLTLVAVTVGIGARLEVCASAAAHDLVPVHDEPLTVLLLTDAAEESGNAELHDAVQNEVGADAGDAVIGLDLQGECRLVASRHFGGAGKAPALEVGNGEVVVTFRQDDELLTIVLDGVIPIHAGVVVDVISHDKNPPLLVQDRAVRIDKVQNLRSVFDEPAGDEFLGIAVDRSVGGIVSLVRHDLLKLRVFHIRLRHEGVKAVDGLARIGSRLGTRLEEVCDVLEVQVHLFRQAVAVLGVPARMVRGIDDALAPLGFLGVRLGRDYIGLVIKEQEHIAPFLQKRRDLLGQLHFPSVVGSLFVGLLKLAHLGVRSDDHVLAGRDDGIESGKQPAELLAENRVALAVAETLDGVLLIFLADIGDAERLCPIRRVQHERLTDIRISRDLADDGEQFLPGLRPFDTAHVHVRGAALGIDEERFRECGGKGRLADALAPVGDHL